ncbi:MAG: hypothetical protein U1E14_01140 [Geminicoccaceae bacterium]
MTARPAWRRRPFGIAVLVVLVAASLWVWGAMERWLPAGGELLRNPGLADDAAGWAVRPGRGQIELGEGTATLVSPAPERSVVVSQTIDIGERRAFRLRARVETDAIVQGEHPEAWHAARVMLVGQRPNGRPDFNRPTDLFRATGTWPASERDTVIVLADGAVGATFMARLDRVSGTMRVSALSVSPVVARPAFTAVARLLGALWSLVLVVAAVRFVTGATSRPAAIAVVGIIAAGIALNLLQAELAVPALRLAQEAAGGLLSYDTLDRLLHLAGFALLALAWRRARERRGLLPVAGVLAALAAGSEVMQGIPGGLGGDDVADALVNLAGVALGLGIGVAAGALNATRGPKPPRA